MKQSDDAVFVVDDDVSVREALRGLVRSLGLRCETFSSASAFLAAERPDTTSCLILDVHLPGLNGLDLPAELGRSGRALPIVFITGQATIPLGVRAMKAGAVEFLTKPFDERALLSAIAQALERDRAAREARLARREDDGRLARLSTRERHVLALAIAGRTTREIAASLGVTERTVELHRGRVMSKLDVGHLASLVRPAQHHVSPGAC
jgi:FixJ family two-component response regulator